MLRLKVPLTITFQALMTANKNINHCADSFCDGFAARAFRRTLTSAERARYRDIIISSGQPQAGITTALQAVLSSPNFLYRSELGQTVESLTAEINAVNIQRQQPTSETQIIAELSGGALGE